ncbi:SAVED domain-containing protein [Streptomyces parvus]|uniref:SAVED domain-containing protein n=1 Tax=Streptomyces parvus TaxID=66428 RepID=UPI00381CF86B
MVAGADLAVLQRGELWSTRDTYDADCEPTVNETVPSSTATAPTPSPSASATPCAHLFLACPMGLALLLGHRWNRLRPTVVYEDVGTVDAYEPAFFVHASPRNPPSRVAGHCDKGPAHKAGHRENLVCADLDC